MQRRDTKRTAIVCGAGMVSGKEIMALELAEGLRARGYPLEIVTARWGDGDFARRLRTLGFPTQALWLGFISATLTWDCLYMTGEQMLRWPQLLAGYRRFLRRVAPEKVIHTNWHHLLVLWPFLKSERDLYWIHDVVPDKPQYRRVFGWLSRRLGCFVPVSHAVAESLRQIGIPSEEIHVIHNGLKDPAPLPSCGHPLPVGRGEGQGEGCSDKRDRLRVGIIGQIGEWKGHEDLLEAFALVLKSHPTAQLHVIGRGVEDYERQLKERVTSLGIADRIFWRGHVAERAEIYRELSICALPSRCSEALPTVAIEAAFFGIPVVATRRGGLPEIVEDGVTGFLCDAESPKQLAARLDQLLQSADLRKKMGEAARRRAVTHFGRERFVDEFVHLLEGNVKGKI